MRVQSVVSVVTRPATAVATAILRGTPSAQRGSGNGEEERNRLRSILKDDASSYHTDSSAHDAIQRMAHAVRQACMRAAIDGYERGGISGLCAEGRFDMAINSLRAIDLDGIVPRVAE